MIGKLPTGRGGAKYAIVAVDYFTKWVKEEPLNKISSTKVINFLIKNVLYRYGVPLKIISDNGLQFDSEEFTDWCREHGINKSFSSVAYPQANGQVKAVNKILKTLIKKKLERLKGAWVDELPTTTRKQVICIGCLPPFCISSTTDAYATDATGLTVLHQF